MAQKFVYTTGGRDVTLDDPNDDYTPQQIKDHWAATFPELSSATWDTKEVDGVKVVTFAKKVGTKGSDIKTLTVSVTGCARCGEDHADMEFRTFLNGPIESCGDGEWTHWAMCPKLNEPVLLCIVVDPDPESEEDEEEG